MVFITVGLMTSCSSQKLYNVFSKSVVISEITIFDYLPIYYNSLPKLRSNIVNVDDIMKLTRIINNSFSVEKKREAGDLMGGPKTFTYQIRFNGSSLPLTQIYIFIEGESIYISSLVLFNQNKNEYKLYQVQKADVNAFLDYVSKVD